MAYGGATVHPLPLYQGGPFMQRPEDVLGSDIDVAYIKTGAHTRTRTQPQHTVHAIGGTGGVNNEGDWSEIEGDRD